MIRSGSAFASFDILLEIVEIQIQVENYILLYIALFKVYTQNDVRTFYTNHNAVDKIYSLFPGLDVEHVVAISCVYFKHNKPFHACPWSESQSPRVCGFITIMNPDPSTLLPSRKKFVFDDTTYIKRRLKVYASDK